MNDNITSQNGGKFKRPEIIIEQVYLDDNKLPIYYDLKDIKFDLTKYDLEPQFREDIAYPKFSLGFQHWIHASKNKSYKFLKFEGKKHVYNIVNSYEKNIDNYEKSIENNELFKNKETIISNDVFALWEIIFYYELININNKNFKSASFTQNYGFSTQTIMYFRELFCDSKNDEYNIINENQENNYENNDEKKIQHNLEEEFYKKNSKKITLNKKIDNVDLIISECGKQWN